MPNSFTINKTKTTNKIILISFDGDVDTDQLPTQLSTGLFNTKRFTITRQTRNKRRVEETGLNNFLKIVKVTKLDEGIIFLWNEVLFDRRNHRRCGDGLFKLLTGFLHSQVPLTTGDFILIKSFSHSGIRDAVGGTVPTNITRSDLITVGIAECVDDVVGHLFETLIGMYVIYMKKPPRRG